MQTALVPKTSPDADRGRVSLSLTVAAQDAATGPAIAAVDAALVSVGMAEDVRLNVQIVLAEALNNVVEHGYAGVDTGVMSLGLTADRHLVQVTLTDWGQAYPDLTIPAAKTPDPMALAEGGYGWFLIHNLTSELAYRREDGCNCLSFQISASADQGS